MEYPDEVQATLDRRLSNPNGTTAIVDDDEGRRWYFVRRGEGWKLSGVGNGPSRVEAQEPTPMPDEDGELNAALDALDNVLSKANAKVVPRQETTAGPYDGEDHEAFSRVGTTKEEFSITVDSKVRPELIFPAGSVVQVDPGDGKGVRRMVMDPPKDVGDGIFTLSGSSKTRRNWHLEDLYKYQWSLGVLDPRRATSRIPII